jgi:hypothetical protein
MGVSPLSHDRPADRFALIMLPISLIVDRPWTHAFTTKRAGGDHRAALVCSAFAYVLYFG